MFQKTKKSQKEIFADRGICPDQRRRFAIFNRQSKAKVILCAFAVSASAFGFIINYFSFRIKLMRPLLFICAFAVSVFLFLSFASKRQITHDHILFYIADPKRQNIELYWKNDKGEFLNSLGNLSTYLENKNRKLLFAMNAGMYKADYFPLGLFIENHKTVTKLNTAEASGNFYMKPNGVFYLTSANIARVVKTEDFKNSPANKYATQSGPMLVTDGKIHASFKKGSENLNVRNGVGILPDNKILFAMSKKEINFYDFAKFFQDLGCKNALYLDGFVSRAYCPEKNWIQTDGNFGVMIGVTEKKIN